MNSNSNNTNDRVILMIIKRGMIHTETPPPDCSLPTPGPYGRNLFLLRRDTLPLAPGNELR